MQHENENGKMRNAGKVYLVGAGPGDSGLITVKAVESLRKADVIVYDRLVSKEILQYRKAGAIVRYVGKEKGNAVNQEKINQLLLEYARKGNFVVRLKGGDPFVFGRGQEEMSFLMSNGIDCCVIPGVSSCYAVPEACGIALTHRAYASGFLVVTGHEDPAKGTKAVNWRQVAKFCGTVVIMMGLSNLKEIRDKLLKFGKPAHTPVAVISRGTTKKEKIVTGTLFDIADKARGLTSPAVCVVGDVVKLRDDLNSKLKPLAGKRYVLTASSALNKAIAGKLKYLGASVAQLPMIRIVPNKDTSALDAVIADSESFRWLVFTSRHGVYYFCKRYREVAALDSKLAGKIACVGTGTAAELARFGINADLIPEKFTTKDLALTLLKKGVAGKKIALLRTNVRRDYLKKTLRKAGARISDCLLYTSEEACSRKSLASAIAKKPDGIFFLSPKSTQVFFDLLPQTCKERLKQIQPFYSIGPVTTRALKVQGVKAVRTAKEYTIDGLTKLCLEEN